MFNPRKNPYYKMVEKLIQTDGQNLTLDLLKSLVEAFRSNTERQLNAINEVCRPLIEYALQMNQLDETEEKRLIEWKQPKFIVSVEWE